MNTLLLHAYFGISRVSAQVFNGPGLQGGVVQASQIEGPIQAPLREVILSFLAKALNFLALAGVIMIVAAGITMIFSIGDDTVKDKAKKIILYVVIGLVIVLFARALVGFFLNGLQ